MSGEGLKDANVPLTTVVAGAQQRAVSGLSSITQMAQ